MAPRIFNTHHAGDTLIIDFVDPLQCIDIHYGVFTRGVRQVVGVLQDLPTNTISGLTITKASDLDVINARYDAIHDFFTIYLTEPQSIPLQDPPPCYDEPRLSLFTLPGVETRIAAIRIFGASINVSNTMI